MLVTGGAGFIGSHLCERLLETSHAVIAVDNYRTSRPANIRHLLSNPRFKILTRDVIEPLDVEVDQVFNLACPASPAHYQRDPVGTLRTSVVGALAVLGLAARHGATALQASTSEVYGEPERHPQTEDYWGKHQPHRPARLLQRGKALRGDAVLRLPSSARLADQSGAHLQHLRPAHDAERRPRGLELHRASPARPTHHHSRKTVNKPGPFAMWTTSSRD